MVEYAIYLPTPVNYPFASCFVDQAIPLQAAFKDLGYDAPIHDEPQYGRTNIVLGAHLLPMVGECYADLVLWNLEQVSPDVPWLSDKYVSLLERYPVLDYSERNIAELAKIGVAAKLLPVGYHPCMRNMEKETPQIEVVHYGSMNERRAKVLQALLDRGVNVRHLFGVYGAERDAVIAQSKLVLNISYYDSKIFNITRCASLFANSVPVVSEIGPGSEAFHGTGGFVEYDGLVDKCMEILAGDLAGVGDKGFEIFSQMPLVDSLKAVLCA